MIDVIGVSFRNGGKVYYFTPGKLPVKRGLHVIVETARGTEYGTVVGDIKQIDETEFSTPVKPILRIATRRDDEQEATNREKEEKALKICKEKIAKHGLDMKLIGAEYTFDSSKVLFYFTADGRVDFRELVKDLAGIFRTRIELRQIGVRDETKILGGIGVCGRPLCCHVYLSDFAPVSIKMAKEQNLSLNPTKISGVCGRLMCCLKNEEDTYEYLNRLMPGVGDTVIAQTEDGPVEGQVHSVNVLRQTVKVLMDDEDGDKEILDFKVEDLKFEPRKGGNKGNKKKPKKQDDASKDDKQEKELAKLEEADENDQKNKKERGDRPDKKGGHGRNQGAGKDRGKNKDQNRKEGNPNRDRRGGQGGKGGHKKNDRDNAKESGQAPQPKTDNQEG
ncbi:MAG: stage 0 sporulation family protein [Lachnospiraceae bacterium]|nr:stage 0 sporulation family protein [Lachnospiraceae bacterium]